MLRLITNGGRQVLLEVGDKVIVHLEYSSFSGTVDMVSAYEDVWYRVTPDDFQEMPIKGWYREEKVEKVEDNS